MASTLNLTTALAGDHWLITGALAAGGTLPLEIFIYENTGTGVLGEFYGTCNIQELGRLQIFHPGTPIPVFGNKYVRYGQVKIDVPLDQDPAAVVAALVKNVKSLSAAYSLQGTTVNSYTIP